MSGALDLTDLRARIARGDGPAFWRSLDALADTDAFRSYLAAEFPAAARMAAGPERRGFLKIMAASFALGGLAACSRSGNDHEVPYVNRPERIVPSAALSYASSTLVDGFANGILVTTRDGRPLKVEGNPDHPWSRGGTDPFGQASVLGLYDPFRSQAVQRLGRPSSWAALNTFLAGRLPALRASGGAGLALVTGPSTSPVLAAGIARMRAAYPGMRWFVDAPVGREAVYEGAEQAFGRPLETRARFDRARVVVALDGDLLDAGPGQVGLSRDWIDARRASARGGGEAGGLLTLHAVAPTPSLTSAKADHSAPASGAEIERIARGLLAAAGGGSADAGADGPLAAWQARASAALLAARGAGIVTVGAHQPAAVHALGHRINAALGNLGGPVFHTDPVAVPGAEPLTALAEAMERGGVQVLVALGCNPVYDAPAELDFAGRLARVPLTIHAGLAFDETAAHAEWHLPLAHPLESWGDARALDGTVSLIQPTIAPLFGGRSADEILALLAGAPRDGLDLLRDAVRREGEDEPAFQTRFAEALRAGFLPDTALPEVAAGLAGSVPPPSAAASEVGADVVEVVFRPDPTIRDGANADSAWLQELPKPLTKVVWENVVAVSPRLAERLAIATGDVVSVESGTRRVEGPAWILPGQAEATATLFLGYGRRVPDHLAFGLGYDAYALRPAATPWTLAGARIARTGRTARPATTQDLGTMEGHDFVRVQTVGAESVGDRDGPPAPSFYPPPQASAREERAWGMVIDLDACTGCNACVMACQSENNIPVVGREEVARGRWMGWLRVDRYYAGGLDAPATHFQPVPCMHCESAPCEVGCPVEATVHDREGLNLMVYNRCVGTRTCSSYCPYKVRRFNYLDYTGDKPAIEVQGRNPDVTVRARGVMEKCTYCIQRIAGARIASAKDAHAPIPDGAVETACQGACPTRAITFGDLSDEGSAVARARSDPRNYALLGELNLRPRTTYLASLAPSAKEG